METWGSWLPADRRAALARGASIPDRADGAVLFADISGFTPLTEALLNAHGPKRGAEEITVHLDRVYDALIAAVDAYGGSVIGFSGDAITCWFGGDEGVRGVAAGLEMQRAMRDLASVRVGGTSEPITLGVKVAVAAGPVRRFQVAHADIQQLDVMAGATLDAVAAAEHLAERGEVVLEGETAHRLGDRVVIATTRTGEGARAAVVTAVAAAAAPAPTDAASALDTVTQDQVRPWILRTVHDRLASGQGAFLAELRPVVAVFVRFTGIDFESDDAEAILDRYVCWAQRVLDRYEGTLVDVTIGDKGSYLAAVVGAPRTHDDDPARAVAAALELRTPPADVAPARTVGIGVSRGRMRAGAFGGKTRRTYGVQGADMNLAARLMMRAPDGRIVVSSQVADTLGDRFELTPVGDVQVKGFALPITTFEVEAARAGGTIRSPHPAGAEIVGREAERAAIAERLDALAQGRSGILTLEGEAGIGKSRLVEDLVDRAGDRDIRTLAGVAEAIEQTTPYHAWRPIFADALGLAEAPADPDEARAWLLARLHELTPSDDRAALDLRALAPLLSPVLPVPIPDTGATEFLTGQSRAETTREVLASILRATARQQPLVVVLDDAQWLDSPSWSLLTRLIGVPEPLLVVIATRPLGEQLPPEIAAILGAPVTHRLSLEPLAGDAIETLIRQRLGVRSIPAPMIEVIRARAEGNPFFSEELAYALRDRGLVVVRDGRCDLAPDTPDLRELAFPDTVEGVVTSRIDRLTPSQQTAMKVASVIGRTFSLDTLRAVHPIPEEAARLDDDLAALARLDLTPVDDAEGGPGYRFKHAITHDVAYDLMLFAQRRALHRAVGEHLEGIGPAQGPHLSLLAHHWAVAADDDDVTPDVLGKAIGYLGGASQEAFLAYANVEAVAHLRKQLGLLARQPESMGRDQQELGAHTMLAFSLVQSRGYGDPEVEASYLRAQALSDRVEDFGPLAFILYGLFSFYASRGEYDPAERIAGRLVALADRQDDQATRSVGLQARAIVRLLRGDLREALDAARESYDIADRLGDRAFFGFGVDFRLYTSAWLALAELLLGFPDRARATHAISESAVERQPYARTFVLGFAFIPQLLDDPAETIRRADELGQLAARYQFFLFTIISNLYRGWALAATSGDPEVLGLIDGSLPVTRFVKLDSFLPWYLGLSADARLRLGRHDEALAAADEALTLAETAGGSFYEAELHRLRAEILAAQDTAPGDVEAAFRRAIEIARRQGARWWELRASAGLVRWAGATAADHEALAALVDTFTEGQSTADVIAAREIVAAGSVALSS
jgi:class 3 adenylate cyclase/tetratricopeptide (TPR) repeat protein